MDWGNGSCLKLIEKYKENRCLWDLSFDQYKNVQKREEAWKNIAWTMNRDVGEVKKKMESLMASFRRERLKCLGKKCEPTENYKTKWFAYKSMKFLLSKYKPRCSLSNIKTVDLDEQEAVADVITIEENQPSTSRTKRELTPPGWEEYQTPSEERPMKRKLMEDPWVDEAYKILKSGLNHDRDGSAVFGEYVATKHRQYDAYTKSTVEHLINNILYEADIGKYSDPKRVRPA